MFRPTNKIGANDDYPLLSKPKKVDWWLRWKQILAFCTALVVGAMAAVAITTVVLVTEGESFQRYTVENDQYFGQFSVSSNSRTIEWDLQHTLAMDDAILALQVRGPIEPGLVDGPLHIALCGTPSTLACDVAVVGVLKDKITQTYDGYSLTTTIDAIRLFPRRYYLDLITAQNTTGLRAYLGYLAGTSG